MRPHATQRNQEPVGDSKAPLVEIPRRAELAAVAGNAFQPVVEKVVDAEVCFARIRAGQSKGIGAVGADFTGVKLLDASYDFGAAHGPLPVARLAEPVRALDPVSAAFK